MEWTKDADESIQKVPFFVRKRVRARVEKEAKNAGKKVVSLADVKATQARYLSGMASEIKGYQIDTCFGPSGCPNRAAVSDQLLQKIESLVKGKDLLGFLKKRVEGDLKFHHEFRITLADCPNACSQPQIKDIGIIGACAPQLTEEPCTMCEACVEGLQGKCDHFDHRKRMPANRVHPVSVLRKVHESLPYRYDFAGRQRIQGTAGRQTRPASTAGKRAAGNLR